MDPLNRWAKDVARTLEKWAEQIRQAFDQTVDVLENHESRIADLEARIARSGDGE